MKVLLRHEWPLVASVVTAVLFLVFGGSWLADLSQPVWFALMLAWPFFAILLSAFAIVRHAECLAVKLGEPLGTLVLTIAVTGLESMVIAAMMYSGPAVSSVARDTMFAVIMIALNGIVGVCLLFGALRYREQEINLYSANAFLAVIIPMAVLGLVLPTFTPAPAHTTSTLHSVFLILMSIGLYAVFLLIQTRWHRDYFVLPPGGQANAHAEHDPYALSEVRSIPYHVALLLLYLLPVLALAKSLAKPIDYGTGVLGAPVALGGMLVAVLILSPESLAAIRAARANHLQRSINIALGSVLASISLTIPAVLIIAFVTGKTVVLGLDAIDTIMLALSLVLAMITFMLARTNVLLGAVHLLLFLAYLMLMFEGTGDL